MWKARDADIWSGEIVLKVERKEGLDILTRRHRKTDSKESKRNEDRRNGISSFSFCPLSWTQYFLTIIFLLLHKQRPHWALRVKLRKFGETSKNSKWTQVKCTSSKINLNILFKFLKFVQNKYDCNAYHYVSTFLPKLGNKNRIWEKSMLTFWEISTRIDYQYDSIGTLELAACSDIRGWFGGICFDEEALQLYRYYKLGRPFVFHIHFLKR